MDFFSNFPKVAYTFINGDTRYALNVVNIQTHVLIMERLRQTMTVFYDYVVQDGERPDSVAYKVYGSTDYTWLVLVVNNIFSLYDWVLSQDEFDDYIIEKYGSLAVASATLLYKTIDGYLIDYDSWLALDPSQRNLTPATAYDDELDKNEAKRRIKVIPGGYVGPLVAGLKDVLS